MVNKRQLARGRMPDGQPNPLDIHIGNRLRLRRVVLGVTQKDLATRVGISHQQVQQYEIGGNRIPSQRLWIFSKLLDVPINFFFEDMDAQIVTKVFNSLPVSETGNIQNFLADECPIAERGDVQELICAYMRLIRNDRTAVAECFRKLIDEVSRSSSRDDDVLPEMINGACLR